MNKKTMLKKISKSPKKDLIQKSLQARHLCAVSQDQKLANKKQISKKKMNYILIQALKLLNLFIMLKVMRMTNGLPLSSLILNCGRKSKNWRKFANLSSRKRLKMNQIDNCKKKVNALEGRNKKNLLTYTYKKINYSHLISENNRKNRIVSRKS